MLYISVGVSWSLIRPLKSAGASINRSCEKLIDPEDSQQQNVGGVVNPGLTTADEQSVSPKKQPTRSSTQKYKSPSDGIDSPLSSPEMSPIGSNSKQKSEKAVISTQRNKAVELESPTTSPKSEQTQSSLAASQLNPLTNVLTNEELLLFATQQISPQTTLQCTIIRDKKGIDRSLYPTYYMHLQGKGEQFISIQLYNVVNDWMDDRFAG